MKTITSILLLLPTIALTSEYFPLEMGQVRIYELRTNWKSNDANVTDTYETMTYEVAEKAIVCGREVYKVSAKSSHYGKGFRFQYKENGDLYYISPNDCRKSLILTTPEIGKQWIRDFEWDSNAHWSEKIEMVRLPNGRTYPDCYRAIIKSLTHFTGYELYCRDVGLVYAFSYVTDHPHLMDEVFLINHN